MNEQIAYPDYALMTTGKITECTKQPLKSTR